MRPLYSHIKHSVYSNSQCQTHILTQRSRKQKRISCHQRELQQFLPNKLIIIPQSFILLTFLQQESILYKAWWQSLEFKTSRYSTFLQEVLSSGKRQYATHIVTMIKFLIQVSVKVKHLLYYVHLNTSQKQHKNWNLRTK